MIDHANHWKGEIIFLIELMKHPKIPKIVKFVIFILLSYIFSPIDLIPDFVPIIGHWDDLIAIPLTMRLIAKITPSEIIQKVRDELIKRGDVALFPGKGPKIAAFTVLLLWVWVSWAFLHAIDYEQYVCALNIDLSFMEFLSCPA